MAVPGLRSTNVLLGTALGTFRSDVGLPPLSRTALYMRLPPPKQLSRVKFSKVNPLFWLPRIQLTLAPMSPIQEVAPQSLFWLFVFFPHWRPLGGLAIPACQERVLRKLQRDGPHWQCCHWSDGVLATALSFPRTEPPLQDQSIRSNCRHPFWWT